MLSEFLINSLEKNAEALLLLAEKGEWVAAGELFEINQALISQCFPIDIHTQYSEDFILAVARLSDLYERLDRIAKAQHPIVLEELTRASQGAKLVNYCF